MENESITASTSPSVGEALRRGWLMSLRYWRITLIYWLAGLILALSAALPLRSSLLSEAGNTLLLDELLPGFHYTFLNDFLQNYGSALTPLLSQSLLVIVLHFLVLLFLTGGLSNTLVKQPKHYDASTFWGGSAAYFWRLLRLSLFFLVLHFLVLSLFAWLYLRVTKGLSPANLESEAIITTSLRWLVPLYVLVAALPMLWQDYAKLQLVATDAHWIWAPIRQSGRFIRRHFLKVYSLYLLLLLVALALLGLNYLLQGAFAVQSLTTVLLSLLLSQLFVVVRFALKVLNLGSIRALLSAGESVAE